LISTWNITGTQKEWMDLTGNKTAQLEHM